MWLVKRALGILFIVAGVAILLTTSFFVGFLFPTGGVPTVVVFRSAVVLSLSTCVVIAGTQLACNFEKV